MLASIVLLTCPGCGGRAKRGVDMATAQAGETTPAPPKMSGLKKRRLVRRFLYVVILLLVVAVVGLSGAAWYFSSQALDATPDRATYSLQVLALHGSTVEIPRTENTVRPGTYRLQWHGGQIKLGDIVSISREGVVRRFSGSAGGLTVGTHVHFDGFIYSLPAALRLTYQTVNVPDPLGPMPAWYIPGKRSTWVIMVHGRGMNRAEGIRPLSTLVGLGLPVLDISYRNDVGAPASPDHLRHQGASEWQDVQAAARYALGHGAHKLILFGYSLGGSASEAFLHRSPDANYVQAVVLDSPALGWDAVLSFRADQQNVPSLVTELAKRVTAWRLGLWTLADVTGVHTAADLKLPTLMFQGTSDTSAPIAPAAAVARARPDLVSYVLVPGASHTQEWNKNPVLYTTRLKAFLARFLG